MHSAMRVVVARKRLTSTLGNFILQTRCTLIQCHAIDPSGAVWKALLHDAGIVLI